MRKVNELVTMLLDTQRDVKFDIKIQTYEGCGVTSSVDFDQITNIIITKDGAKPHHTEREYFIEHSEDTGKFTYIIWDEQDEIHVFINIGTSINEVHYFIKHL